MVHFPSDVLSLICAYSGFTYDQKLKKMQKKLSIMIEILINCKYWYCNNCEDWYYSHCRISWEEGNNVKCANAIKNFKLNKSNYSTDFPLSFSKLNKIQIGARKIRKKLNNNGFYYCLICNNWVKESDYRAQQHESQGMYLEIEHYSWIRQCEPCLESKPNTGPNCPCFKCKHNWKVGMKYLETNGGVEPEFYYEDGKKIS